MYICDTCTMGALQFWYHSVVMISVIGNWSMENGQLGLEVDKVGY